MKVGPVRIVEPEADATPEEAREAQRADLAARLAASEAEARAKYERVKAAAPKYELGHIPLDSDERGRTGRRCRCGSFCLAADAGYMDWIRKHGVSCAPSTRAAGAVDTSEASGD